MTERMIEANGVELCAQSFGDPGDPPILLIMGIGSSMLWWDERLCRKLADGGRFVIRYDHRDTGRSVTYEPGCPGYTGDDLVADSAGVLDAHGIEAAHLVGASAGGAFAQLLSLGRPERVRSLVLISTSFAVPTSRKLPPPTDEFGRGVAELQVDWSEPQSVIEYLVDYSRLLAGGQRRFDEGAAWDLARSDVERAHDFAAAQNHDRLRQEASAAKTLAAIAVPTLVIHGTADPMFPIEHGQALADEISDASFLQLKEAGHGVERADWDAIASAILSHTAER